MRLSEIKNKVPIKIIRDGIFRSVGKMTQNKPSQLVFLSDESYISNLSKRNNISCIITSKKIASMFSKKIGLVIADNPRKTFYLIHSI